MSESEQQRPKEPAVFVLTLVGKPGSDGIHALRALLKIALRRFGLKCIDVQERPTA